MKQGRIRKLTPKEIRKSENLWMRHCNQFVRSGYVPRLYVELPEYLRTERMKRFYKFLTKWMDKNGNDYQRSELSRRKEEFKKRPQSQSTKNIQTETSLL